MDILNPLVSVGITTYNRPKGLMRTLECITGQSYQNLEIIVADNCSFGDETRKIVIKFQKTDKRIVYFRHDKNMGAAYNGKFVVEKASGNFFMWASDDDEWYPTYIEKCIDILGKHESVGSCCSNWIVVVESTVISNNSKICCLNRKDNSHLKEIKYFSGIEDINTHDLTQLKRLKKYILQSGTNSGIHAVFRTNIIKGIYQDSACFDKIGGFDRIIGARINLISSIYQIPENLIVYHHHGKGAGLNPLSSNKSFHDIEHYITYFNPLLAAYLNMIFDSLSWSVSIPDHIRIIGYYLARMAKAKILRYTLKTPFIGTPFYDYKPPEYPKRS